MSVQDHIELQQSRIAALNSKISTATALGEVDRLAELEAERAEAEETLARLRAA
jgi:hypothetical protein